MLDLKVVENYNLKLIVSRQRPDSLPPQQDAPDPLPD